MKKILLLATMFGTLSNVARADITNPFYISEKAFLSETKLSFGQKRFDAAVLSPRTGVLRSAKFHRLDEQLSYGITNTWAVYGSLGYDRTGQTGTGTLKIGEWSLGTKVNTIDEAWRIQIGADISRKHYRSWRGVKNDTGKDTHLYVMGGTETGERVFFYMRGDYHSIEYNNQRSYNLYEATAAAHITSEKGITADGGLTFSMDDMQGVKNRDLTLFAKGYKAINNAMSVGLEADYVLASENSIKAAFAPDNQGSYSLGVSFKYEF